MIQKAVDKRTALKDTKTKVDEVTGKRKSSGVFI